VFPAYSVHYVIAALFALIVSFMQTAPSRDGSPVEGTNVLWYRQPAANWNQALPVGNGRLGAMVFGGTADERLPVGVDLAWAAGKATRAVLHPRLDGVFRVRPPEDKRVAAITAGAKATPMTELADGSIKVQLAGGRDYILSFR
jgi:Glycosyl hydrolase family 65, N-terminal domain